MIGIHKAKRCA